MTDALEKCLAVSRDRIGFWTEFIRSRRITTMAEIGVYRGGLAARILGECPDVKTYYMVDPWRNLADWNKPANRGESEFQRIFEDAMEKTAFAGDRRIVLRGKTVEVSSHIPDHALDFCYIDGDHTLRGIAVDLTRMYGKVRQDGWIGGDDFVPNIWQHHSQYEPTLVFPMAVYFAEGMNVPITALPWYQFLLRKTNTGGHAFHDLTGRYQDRTLRSQFSLRHLLTSRLNERFPFLTRRRRWGWMRRINKAVARWRR
jgi:hypothetical protein